MVPLNGVDVLMGPDIPVWLAGLIILITAIGKNVLPHLATLFKINVKNRDEQIRILTEDVSRLQSENQKLRDELDKVKRKYNYLSGLIRGFRIYLKEHGFEDFPDINE